MSEEDIEMGSPVETRKNKNKAERAPLLSDVIVESEPLHDEKLKFKVPIYFYCLYVPFLMLFYFILIYYLSWEE
jgi:hypothetical protein